MLTAHGCIDEIVETAEKHPSPMVMALRAVQFGHMWETTTQPQLTEIDHFCCMYFTVTML